MTYVYPVVSRRARGVSIGINLNPNNACNWRCVYCQVPDLTQGKAPPVDLALLEDELTAMLERLVHSDWMERNVPEGSRRLNDIAFSGNGEPTSADAFPEVVALVRRKLDAFPSLAPTKLVLITNGSLVHLEHVQRGLVHLAAGRGEVWFKLDGGTDAFLARFNGDRVGAQRRERNLALAARLAPTWVQTMALAWNGEPPPEREREAYLALLGRVLAGGSRLEGVHLYGLARPSHQVEAPDLSPLDPAWMEAFADRIRALGLEVTVSV